MLLRKLRNESVLVTHPLLVEEQWSPKNYPGPEFFGAGSSENVQWICEEGQEIHKFLRPIGRITRAFDNHSKFGGCPYCSGRMPTKQESLVSIPELASQWMKKENGCTARYVNVSSRRLAQWQCPFNKGHAYRTKVCARTAKLGGQGCPFCYHGARVNLVQFDGALAQYVRTALNRGFNLTDLPRAFKVFWRCGTNPDHLWYESFDKLQKREFTCPKCYEADNAKPAATLADFPDLVTQIDPTANEVLDPSQISTGSHIKITWKCSAGLDHVWQARVFNRTLNAAGCPCCANKQISVTNCLATIAPNLCKDFHPSLNGSDTADSIIATSNKSCWWLCQFCSHEWQMAVRARTIGKSLCPTCKAGPASTAPILSVGFVRSTIRSIAQGNQFTKQLKSLKPCPV
jgi:hypothetical protein